MIRSGETLPMGGTMRADDELLGLAGDGDEGAAAELFDRHSARVLRFLTLMLGDVQAAEDALQNSFAYLFGHAADYDSEKAAVSTWLMRIARSYAKNELRRRGRKPFLSLDTPIPGGQGEGRPLVDLLPGEESRHAAEDVSLALAMLEKLSRQDREALIMRFVDGLEPREIAVVLGLNPKAVSMRIWRALKRLRDSVEAESDSV
jgi:RNA polymerase sigma-70 factor (ECF subfamily)